MYKVRLCFSYILVIIKDWDVYLLIGRLSQFCKNQEGILQSLCNPSTPIWAQLNRCQKLQHILFKNLHLFLNSWRASLCSHIHILLDIRKWMNHFHQWLLYALVPWIFWIRIGSADCSLCRTRGKLESNYCHSCISVYQKRLLYYA